MKSPPKSTKFIKTNWFTCKCYHHVFLCFGLGLGMILALRSLRSLIVSTMRILNVRERGLGRGWEATFHNAAATFAFAVLFPSKCDVVDPFGPLLPVLTSVCFQLLLRTSVVLWGSLGGFSDPPLGHLRAAVGRFCFSPAWSPACPAFVFLCMCSCA